MPCHILLLCFFEGEKETKVTTVVATPGYGSDRAQEVAYTDTKIIGKVSKKKLLFDYCSTLLGVWLTGQCYMLYILILKHLQP